MQSFSVGRGWLTDMSSALLKLIAKPLAPNVKFMLGDATVPAIRRVTAVSLAYSSDSFRRVSIRPTRIGSRMYVLPPCICFDRIAGFTLNVNARRIGVSPPASATIDKAAGERYAAKVMQEIIRAVVADPTLFGVLQTGLLWAKESSAGQNVDTGTLLCGGEITFGATWEWTP